MKCWKCKIKTARIAIIDEHGNYYEQDAMCCHCFAKDMNEKLAEAQKAKKAREN